jgi:hypothetical protein
MSDILKLTVPEQEGKKELKNYNFTQLQDLLNRLMLVTGKAGKGSDSVDRFTMASVIFKTFYVNIMIRIMCIIIV